MSADIETLAKIKEEIEEIVNSKEAEKDENLKKAAAAKERREKALNEAAEAHSVADVKAYHKAKDEARMNEDAAAMYEGIARVIEEKACITKEQYEDYIARVTNSLNATVEEDSLILADLAKGLKELKDNLSEEIAAGNKLLEFIQKKAYKDPCGIIAKNGEFVQQPFRIKRYKNTKILESLNFVLSEPYLEEVIKEN